MSFRNKEQGRASQTTYSNAVLAMITPDQQEKRKINKKNLKEFISSVHSADATRVQKITLTNAIGAAYLNSGMKPPSKKTISKIGELDNLSLSRGKGTRGVISEIICLLMRVGSEVTDEELIGELSRATPASLPLLYSKRAAEAEKAIHDEYVKTRPKPRGIGDLYVCPDCGEEEFTIYEVKTRAADEGMTVYITCVSCGYRIVE